MAAANQYFDDIAKRYGVGIGVLQDAWKKTDKGDDKEAHIKRFKAYLTKLTGEASNNYELSQIPQRVSEEIGRVMVQMDFDKLKEEIYYALQSR